MPRSHALGTETWKDGKKRNVARDAKGRFVSKWITKRSRGINRRDRQGNVVLAYTSSCLLMLDCDLKPELEVREFAEEYAKFHKLGTVVVFKTSDSSMTDLFGNRLGNYCIIFGKELSWDEIQWHIDECKRSGMINRAFAKLRQFGSITIRVNAKNDKIPAPKPVSYFSNGDDTGVMAFLRHWVMCRKIG